MRGAHDSVLDQAAVRMETAGFRKGSAPRNAIAAEMQPAGPQSHVGIVLVEVHGMAV